MEKEIEAKEEKRQMEKKPIEMHRAEAAGEKEMKSAGTPKTEAWRDAERKTAEAPKEEKGEKEEGIERKYIVRVVGKDLDGNLPVFRALQGIKGIGIRSGRMVAYAFEKKTGIAYNMPLGDVPVQHHKVLEDIVLNPSAAGIPAWALNRRNDFETGNNMHVVMADLDFSLRKDLQREKQMKTYKGLRHSWGLTVRGQRTRTSGRKKGAQVGVLKKDIKAVMEKKGSEEKEKKK